LSAIYKTSGPFGLSSHPLSSERLSLRPWGVRPAIRARARAPAPAAAFRTPVAGSERSMPAGSGDPRHNDGAPTTDERQQSPQAPRKPTTVADVMTRDVICVAPDTGVREIAETLVRNRVSAVPVVDGDRRLVGIVSEGDLLRRVEIGTERDRRWWVEMFRDAGTAAADYIKAHGRKASYVMTPSPVTATEGMSLDEVARLLAKKRIKRLPVLRDGELIGIVSRADLVRAVAESAEERVAAEAVPDYAIETDLTARIKEMPVGNMRVHASVQNGVASLVGPISSVAERQAFHVAAENTPGVRAVNDRLFRWPTTAA
jgi:CBS domain-containing protein